MLQDERFQDTGPRPDWQIGSGYGDDLGLEIKELNRHDPKERPLNRQDAKEKPLNRQDAKTAKEEERREEIKSENSKSVNFQLFGSSLSLSWRSWRLGGSIPQLQVLASLGGSISPTPGSGVLAVQFPELTPISKNPVQQPRAFRNIRIGLQPRRTSKGPIMQTSEVRIEANRRNAAKSTGPKTDEGKAISRRNSLKHGLTGAGVVLPEADAAEVKRRTAVFADELDAIGEVAQALARLAALNSVRVERAADQQTAALAQRVRQVEADFVPPEGLDEEEAAKLRSEAVRIAMFDPSPEAILARKYEAAAERGFYKAIRLLRQMDKESDALLKAEETRRVDAMVGSILNRHNQYQKLDAEMDALYPELAEPMPGRPANSTQVATKGEAFDVPITIGRPG